MSQLKNSSNIFNVWKLLSPVYYKNGFRKNLPRLASANSPSVDLKKENVAAEVSSPSTSDEITLTDRCAERLKRVAGENECLRILVDSGGCSGFEYKFELVDCNKLDKDDKIFEKNGAKVVVDDLSLNFMRGSVVDYTEELIKAAFRIVTNPKAAKGCSCGSSFALKPEK